MTSWFAANPVPSYASWELEPKVKAPPYSFGGVSTTDTELEEAMSVKTKTYIDPDHNSLILSRRAWDVDIQIEAVLTLSCGWRGCVEEGDSTIAAGFWIIELLETCWTVFCRVEWCFPRSRACGWRKSGG